MCFVSLFAVITVDGGTAWMARESVVLETDVVDSNVIEAPWWNLALQLKQDLTSIILMSEGDLQVWAGFHCFTLESCVAD